MFGFVTFVYPETVKLILAKGNPHFICDARVLVKPYKEKGKVPEKYRYASLRSTFSPLKLYIISDPNWGFLSGPSQLEIEVISQAVPPLLASTQETLLTSNN